ncbi:hypothetical protein [Luteibacter sp. 9135]|uniref:hypothetical protein n=1 Tax=Luteibacter sp. 9135 TaxID=1500893 RepID=UPI00056C959B|nr:hypothetical protein [Luteibacter sp. 9135]
MVVANALKQVAVVPAAVEQHQGCVGLDRLVEKGIGDFHVRRTAVVFQRIDAHRVEALVHGQAVDRQQALEAEPPRGPRGHGLLEVHRVQGVGGGEARLACGIHEDADRLPGVPLVAPGDGLRPGGDDVHRLAQLPFLRHGKVLGLVDRGERHRLANTRDQRHLVLVVAIEAQQRGPQVGEQFLLGIRLGQAFHARLELGAIGRVHRCLGLVAARPVRAQIGEIGRGQGMAPEHVELAVADQLQRSACGVLRRTAARRARRFRLFLVAGGDGHEQGQEDRYQQEGAAHGGFDVSARRGRGAYKKKPRRLIVSRGYPARSR